MDSVTQAVLGGAIGEAILGKELSYKGALLGAGIATIPDLDVILYLFYDPFEMLSIHRGFSHSILFSLIFSLLLAFIFRRIKLTSGIGIYKLWLFFFLALFTHIILDTFTAYGTQLLLPLTDQRFGLDSINVVDPVYTVPLLVGLFISLFGKKPGRTVYNKLGLVLSSFYLCFTMVIKSHVTNHFEKQLAEQQLTYHSLLTMPVGVASLNWYGVAKSKDGIFMQKYSILENEKSSFTYFPTNDYLLDGLNENLVRKMKWFSKGFYTVDKTDDEIRFYNLQVDMRGIVNDDQTKVPTAGYFILGKNEDGSFRFSSGSHK